ncbi:MAG: hypothetical protein K2N56_02360 [Oscillospiraceae bacterium]|nr:hypothetical protein [Oscillospiraceae bacterium]
MKKLAFFLIVVVCLTFAGCVDGEKAREYYYSDEQIASLHENYSETGSKLESSGNKGFSYKSTKFNGYNTVWNVSGLNDGSAVANASLSLSEGQAKLVHIDADNKVTTIVECSGEEGSKTVEVRLSMTNGKNRFKLVGYDCKDIEVKLSLD